MKKFISILAAVTLMFNLPIITNASNANISGSHPSDKNAEIIDLGDGLTIEYTITESNPNARASTRTATKTANCKRDGITIATIKLTATFSYTGSSATCTSASSSYTMYDGWSYSNRTTTRSGNTATTSAKLSKWLDHANVTITMTCSNSGVIS